MLTTHDDRVKQFEETPLARARFQTSCGIKQITAFASRPIRGKFVQALRVNSTKQNSYQANLPEVRSIHKVPNFFLMKDNKRVS